MEIRTLDWDSDFFGLRIGRVDIQTNVDTAELQARQKKLKQQFDLLYIFDTNAVGFTVEGAHLVDEKILYSKSCEPCKQFSAITFYQGTSPSDDLYRLALVSGGYSRFKFDERLPQGSYEKLYRKWIEKACPSYGTNKQILLFKDEHNIARGMITVEYEGDKAQIGLVAVDADCQRQGVGTKIMSTMESYLYHRGVLTIDVATQAANIEACRWYERNGFKVQSKTLIYHWWL